MHEWYTDSNTFILQIIKDWKLLVVVGLLVAIGLIIMAIGTAVPNSMLRAKRIVVDELRRSVSMYISHA